MKKIKFFIPSLFMTIYSTIQPFFMNPDTPEDKMTIISICMLIAVISVIVHMLAFYKLIQNNIKEEHFSNELKYKNLEVKLNLLDENQKKLENNRKD